MQVYKTMENGVQIVEYEDSLAATIADMWNQSGDSWGGDNEINTAEKVIADHADGSFFNVYVALYNGEAIGYCSFARYYKDADTAYVKLLNVRPDFHSKKVGKELVLMCVNRTIELGYPRLDIHTWAGNTKAVPLYKKCGFLWEDRADTTHLSNFIPTVLKTELFSDFFETADWYSDSNKVIEIKTDGVKTNKFEIYGYSWAKDGKNLAVDFEKTGRKIRYVETDDYKIEFMADNHELAFGLNYNCSFKVENKSGRDLNVKISGKNDTGILFNYDDEKFIADKAEFNAEFYVEAITEEIDTGRVHPSVVADVYINGKHVEFGLGIEPKFPLSVRLIEKRNIAKPGLVEDIYINIKSCLAQNASVNFKIPDNDFTKFYEDKFSAETEPGKSSMISAKAEILKCGYAKLDVVYDITLADGSKTNFTKPIYLINQGVNGMFSYETDDEHGAVNGVWRVHLNKKTNNVSFYRIGGQGNANFHISKLGKPYNDEFNLAKATEVKIGGKVGETGETLMTLEASYESTKFKGIVMTMIYEFNASGIVSRIHRVKNISDKSMSVYLSEQLYTSVGRRATFYYDGNINELTNDTAYGFANVHQEKMGENWIFDSSPQNPAGVYWDKEYRPTAKWGDEISFEHEISDLSPGDIFETKPFVYMCGIFNNFKDFRNYVLGINEEITPHTTEHLDICVNKNNPFISVGIDNAESIQAVVKNNRLTIYGGDVGFKSSDGLFDEQIQVNPPKDIVEENIFNAELNKKTPGIYSVELNLRFQSYEKTHRRALFITDKSQKSQKINTEIAGDTYTVSNGNLVFKAAPDYSPALYSMKYGSNEWLFSKYPVAEPYSWWNPFIGGIQARLPNMNDALIQREKTTAEFTTVKDNFGSEWTGIKTIVLVNEFEEHKGMTYEQYYVTLPGLPVLCYFVKVINNTGEYRQTHVGIEGYISDKEKLTDIYASVKTTDREEYRLRVGSDIWQGFDKVAKISYENQNARNEKLYVYNDAVRNYGNMRVYSDINSFGIDGWANINVTDKSSYTICPIFFVLTEKDLAPEDFTDFERIIF